MIQAIDE